ncbi:hypothetical protein OsI_28155 [Oryza sativa Indica Group]|uniref:Uncharacterized protein n=1 Tax=Oryza sativa subsp. indica TaxID=39946 RepID=B8BBQ7_ORYSI|nr:hypothetical protein OsI_28155 [Oryza sativa Indica Group]
MCSTKCPRRKPSRPAGAALRKTGSAPSPTRSCTTSCRSCGRGRWRAPACSPAAGATSGPPRPASTSGVWGGGGHLPPPERLARFAYRLLFEREVSAPVDILRVMSSPDGEGEEDYTTSDVQTWIRAAIKRRARVIQLTDHPMDEAFFNLGFVPIISCHLKHLKLSGSLLWNTTLMQLSSQCPALEILELKKCSLHGHEISSTSLKSLTMSKSKGSNPNVDPESTPARRWQLATGEPIQSVHILVSFVVHHRRAVNRGSQSFRRSSTSSKQIQSAQATSSIKQSNPQASSGCTNKHSDPVLRHHVSRSQAVLVADLVVASRRGSSLSPHSHWPVAALSSSPPAPSSSHYKDFDEDAIDGINSDDGEGCTSDSDYDDSDANTCEYSEIADDYDDEKQRQEHCEGHNPIDDYDDENQHEEHGEEHNQIGHDEVLGGHNVLHILSNAEILELLADGGEVILNRALKTCPTFRNLKTLSLGEWCMGADFDPLVTFLQHSPNLERLFLELKLGFPPDHSNVKLEGGCREEAAPVSSEVQSICADHAGSTACDASFEYIGTKYIWLPECENDLI